MDKPWFRIVEIFLLAVIAIVLIIGQFLPDQSKTEAPIYNKIMNLTQWPASHGGNDHWYGVLNKELYWEQALFEAGAIEINGQTGYLATVTSMNENEFIRSKVIMKTSQPSIFDAFWLGGKNVDGSWHWITDEPFLIENWSDYEPNNIELETALSMWGPSHWEANQQPGEWNNLLPDSDINRTNRIWSVIEFGEPNSSLNGPLTKPTTPKTKTATSLPASLTASPIDSLIHLTKWRSAVGGNDHWYGIMTIDRDQAEAIKVATKLTAYGLTAHLATISSQAENDFILYKMIRGYRAPTNTNQYWIGGGYIKNSWQWYTSEPMTYTNWSVGEPNKIGLENAIAFYGPYCSEKGRIPGKWNNSYSSLAENPLAHFWSIVEFEPPDNSNK